MFKEATMVKQQIQAWVIYLWRKYVGYIFGTKATTRNGDGSPRRQQNKKGTQVGRWVHFPAQSKNTWVHAEDVLAFADWHASWREYLDNTRCATDGRFDYAKTKQMRALVAHRPLPTNVRTVKNPCAN